MDLFRSSIKSVLGTGNVSSQPTAHETVECLVERINSSTLLEDRRDACRALKGLSRTYRLLVGSQAMDTLIHVLSTDRGDPDIMSFSLKTLDNITTSEVFQEEIDLNCENGDLTQAVASLGEQFSEIFTKHPSNVGLLLDILDDHEFNTKWSTVRVLMNLLKNQRKIMQEIILACPLAPSILMDLLTDTREVIRNEALLILDLLIKGNVSLQRLVVFESGFDHLLGIIKHEGYSEGNVVVEDCLHILINLLKNNISNQILFREGDCIKQLTPFFHLNQQVVSEGLSAQTVSNIDHMLQVVRTLVSPSNPSFHVSICQNLMNQSGLLQALCEVLMANELTVKLFKDTINTVAEVMCKNITNQQYFLSLTAAESSPPRPVLVGLLFSMVNEKQPFALRCAVLYCVQCFLSKNTDGQKLIAMTILPNSNKDVTPGSLLFHGLFSQLELSNWFAAVALSYTINENEYLKETLLCVRCYDAEGKGPTLLQHCAMLCLKTLRLQTRIGTLILLCTWLSYCPKAVKNFLQIDDALSFVLAKVVSHDGDEMEELCRGIFAFLLGICVQFNDNSSPTISKEYLIRLIEKRVGFEAFGNKVNQVSKHELYTRAHKHPQLDYDSPKDVVFDFEFCRLFKALESIVINAVISETVDARNRPLDSSAPAEEEKIVNHYKDVIRQQDEKLKILYDENQKLLQEIEHKNVGRTLQDKSTNTTFEEQIVNDRTEYKSESETVKHLENVIAGMQTEKEQAEIVMAKIRREEEDLLILLATYETRLNSYKDRLFDLGVKVSDDEDDGADTDRLVIDEGFSD